MNFGIRACLTRKDLMKSIIWIYINWKWHKSLVTTIMERITKEQYGFALNRIEELLPLVTDETPANDKNAIELTLMSEIVESYEKKHFPIEKRSLDK